MYVRARKTTHAGRNSAGKQGLLGSKSLLHLGYWVAPVPVAGTAHLSTPKSYSEQLFSDSVGTAKSFDR